MLRTLSAKTVYQFPSVSSQPAVTRLAGVAAGWDAVNDPGVPPTVVEVPFCAAGGPVTSSIPPASFHAIHSAPPVFATTKPVSVVPKPVVTNAEELQAVVAKLLFLPDQPTLRDGVVRVPF